MTRTLLAGGFVGGLLYVAVVLLQMLIREGFDISRHPASLLSNGDLGWIQVGNFAVSGLLIMAGAVGLHRVQDPSAGRGGAWGPRLIGVFGAGMIAAAIFTADPVDGFPPGTPLGPPTSVSPEGMAHFLVGMIGFVALMVACFVFGRRFAAAGNRGWAAFSRITGAFFVVTWIALFVLPGARVVSVAFALAIGLAMVWTSLLARHRLMLAKEEDAEPVDSAS